MDEAPLPPIRRLVTVEGPDGGEVLTDALLEGGRLVCDGVRSLHVWATGSAPAPLRMVGDGADLLAGAPPPPGGTRVGVLDIAPGATAGPPHRTDTIDYAVCLAGAIELVLGAERRRLGPGDVVVQGGATHTWRNPGPAPARLFYVMTDAEPKRAGSLGRTDSVAGVRPR